MLAYESWPFTFLIKHLQWETMKTSCQNRSIDSEFGWILLVLVTVMMVWNRNSRHTTLPISKIEQNLKWWAEQKAERPVWPCIQE